MLQALKEMVHTDEDLLVCKRLRISVDKIYRDEIFSIGLSRYIGSLNGIKLAKANPSTGRILVVFNEEVINEKFIKVEINNYVSGKNIIHKDTDPSRKTNISREQRAILRDVSAPNKKTNYPYHVVNTSYLEKKLNTDLQYGLSLSLIHI